MMKTNLTNQLLDWYRENGRELPWRVKGGAHENAYAVWISEIMLQQTTVATVIDYFLKWMQKFPTIKALANADEQEVLLAWQGMGYYTRARKIHECAKVLMKEYGGKIPNDREKLLKLPGIGPYSASSICCFAFNMPETVVDGNVIRVIARLKGITEQVDAKDIYPLAQQLTSPTQGADYASAIMDLGATTCTPTNPKCDLCPWRKSCIARQKEIQEQIPVIKKLLKKEVVGQVFLIQNDKGKYFIRKRTEKGLLHGLWEFPWVQEVGPKIGPKITHVFTHFKLILEMVKLNKTDSLSKQIQIKYPDGIWVTPTDFNKYPFSTLMQKVIKKDLNRFPAKPEK